MSSEQLDKLAVETRKIADLIPDPRNANTHTAEQVDTIVASIKQFGFNDPLGIDENGLILEGHGRYLAAKKMRRKTVPVVVIPGLTEEEKAGYAIAHNQTQRNTGLDEKKMRAEFNAVEVTDQDFLATGFTPDEAFFLMMEDEEPGEGADGAHDHNGHERVNFGAVLPKVHKTVLQFEDMESFGIWDSFTQHLMNRYLDAGSMAERLMLFIDEQAEVLSE